MSASRLRAIYSSVPDFAAHRRCGKIAAGVARKEVTLTGVPEAMLREATQLQRQNRVPEAIDAYLDILRRWPELAECWFNLAVLQRQARRLTDALDSYQKALNAGVSRPEEAHLNRSVIYTDYLGQHAAAERELKAALLNLANLYEDLGRRSEAQGIYARILALDPRCFEALARLANLQPPAAADPALIAQLKRGLADATASAAERASLGFALGRMLDAAGDYPAAFAAIDAANRASRESAAPHVVRYDR